MQGWSAASAVLAAVGAVLWSGMVKESVVVSCGQLLALIFVGWTLKSIRDDSGGFWDGFWHLGEGISTRCAIIERRLMRIEYSPYECQRQMISAIIEWDMAVDP